VNNFNPSYDNVKEALDRIDPIAYGSTRNYVNGAVTRISPFISRGIISTRQVLEHVLHKGYEPRSIESFIQELAWRDYWQEVWRQKGDLINDDLKSPQKDAFRQGIPNAIVNGETGILAIDNGINELKNTGYMHNHVRMYVASLSCNFGKCHWKSPAKWMYYYLLDADWASNALSWQWIVGANSSKKYIANQDNINKFCQTQQKGTFLDLPYESLLKTSIPDPLNEIINPKLYTNLPPALIPSINSELPILLYNFYNLDPDWHNDKEFNRILLLEPEFFAKFPVSDYTITFIYKCAENIPGIKVFCGNVNELLKAFPDHKFIFKEHPLNEHYPGEGQSAETMFGIKGYYPSFFTFWKKCSKVLYG